MVYIAFANIFGCKVPVPCAAPISGECSPSAPTIPAESLHGFSQDYRNMGPSQISFDMFRSLLWIEIISIYIFKYIFWCEDLGHIGIALLSIIYTCVSAFSLFWADCHDHPAGASIHSKHYLPVFSHSHQVFREFECYIHCMRKQYMTFDDCCFPYWNGIFEPQIYYRNDFQLTSNLHIGM